MKGYDIYMNNVTASFRKMTTTERKNWIKTKEFWVTNPEFLGEPLVFDTNGINPFDENGLLIVKNIPGALLVGILEMYRDYPLAVHFLIMGENNPRHFDVWDYSRTFILRTRKCPGSLKYQDIDPGKKYKITADCGLNYVYIDEEEGE